jgi:hypothetical protein
MLDDLHTGTGTGSGDIDALVARDRQGWPVIRASHVRGLLREAGEELIAHGALRPSALDALLGAPGKQRGALRMTSLRTVGDMAGTLVWGSTARTKGSRAPQPDTLRYVEYVASGTAFQATLRLDGPESRPLLERLLVRIDRVGGDRNRGGGLIQLVWRELPAPPQPVPQPTGTRLRLVLRNLEPLCLPATGHPGNLIQGLSFIRGQTLRGALLAWAIQTGRAEAVETFKSLAVGDALPLPEGLAPAAIVLPMPLSIGTPKPQAGDPDIPWWAVDSSDPVPVDRLCQHEEQEGRDGQRENLKRPGAHEYLCRADARKSWIRYAPSMRVRLRNATPKRGSNGEAILFSAEEIAEDTCFQAELRFADQAASAAFAETFAPLFGGDWLAVGRGGAPVVVESISTVEGNLATQGGGAEYQDEWILTLTSDLIARGPNLGFLDNLDIPALWRLAGRTEPERSEGKLRILDRAAETERVYGFNAVTGLPRAPALALRRGSCWKVGGEGGAVLAAALDAKGALGERTGEGFGRFLIDVQRGDGAFVKSQAKAGPPNPRPHETLLALARELAGQIKNPGPSLSQLQWLREQALAATDGKQLDALLWEIETAPDRRPQGGKAWRNFPVKDVREASLELPEKRQLISYLVKWRIPKAKDARR